VQTLLLLQLLQHQHIFKGCAQVHLMQTRIKSYELVRGGKETLFVAAASTKCYAAENMRFNSATGSSFSQTLLQANTLVEFRKLQIAFFNVVSST
jgi:hypothetical protein